MREHSPSRPADRSEQRVPAAQPGGTPQARILGLQGSAGNQAVAQRLSPSPSLTSFAPAGPATETGPATDPGATPAPEPAAPDAPVVHPTIRRGSKGPDVAEAQTKLNLGGATPPLVVDEKFGPLTQAATRDFQRKHALDPDGIIGPKTWAALDTLKSPPPPLGPDQQGEPGRRPVLVVTQRGAGVGLLQQKLNAVNTQPRLRITAEFEMTTFIALAAFQMRERLPLTGQADAATWDRLDTLAPGGGLGNDDLLQGPNEANPVAIPRAGTSLHPRVGPASAGTAANPITSTGTAVEELREKLNIAGASPVLPITTSFDAALGAAVTSFQTTHTITPAPAPGIADAQTWAALDAAAPSGVHQGRVRRDWTENVEGQVYGDVSDYSWHLLPREAPTQIRIDKKIFFRTAPGEPAPLSPKASWSTLITNAWNKFDAVDFADPALPHIQINFNPQIVAAATEDSHIIDIHSGSGRANSRNWFLTDPNEAETIPHEFGHQIGLQDEYRISAADYERTTGHIAPQGDINGDPSAAPPATIATNIRNAIDPATTVPANRGAAAAAVVQANKLRQGAFSQRVAQSYQSQFGNDIVADLSANIPNGPAPAGQTGPVTFNEMVCIEPFTYSSGSLMGDPGTSTSTLPFPGHKNDHDHGVQPRHVREFVDCIKQAFPSGAWIVLPR